MNLFSSLMELTTSTFVRSLFEPEKNEQNVLSGTVYFLGKSYLLPIEQTSFEKDVITRFLFTYRQGFPPIGEPEMTSDQGWGCMLRCGQMMMAHALVCHQLGRDWLWDYSLKPNNVKSTTALNQLQTYHSILRCFLDKKEAPYSVHTLTSIGVLDGKQVGEWYGPNTIAHVLKKACQKDASNDMVVHVCMDNTVIINDILDVCKRDGDSGKDTEWIPLLLIIPLRLGVSHMNHTYYKPLKTFFELKQSVGVLGGRPNNAYWFVGYSDDFLLYLDPHIVQAVCDENNMHSSFHITSPSHIHVSQLDPSIAAGFICTSEQDFRDLMDSLKQQIINDSKSAAFEVHTTRPPHLTSHNCVFTTASSGFNADDLGDGDSSLKAASLNDFEIVNCEDEFEIID